MHEADSAFHRKYGFPPLTQNMSYPPLIPGAEQLRHGSIDSVYERHGICRKYSSPQTLPEWDSVTRSGNTSLAPSTAASKPSSQAVTPKAHWSNRGSQKCSPSLRSSKPLRIEGQPAGILFMENLDPLDLSLEDAKTIVVANLGAIYPPAPLYDKKAQCERLLKIQDTVACLNSS